MQPILSVSVLRVRKSGTPPSLGLELAGGSGTPITVARIAPGGAVATQCAGRIALGDTLVSIRGRLSVSGVGGSASEATLCSGPTEQALQATDAGESGCRTGPAAPSTLDPASARSFGWMGVTTTDTLAAVQRRLAVGGDVIELKIERGGSKSTGKGKGMWARRTSPLSPLFAPWDADWQILGGKAGAADTGDGAGQTSQVVLSKLHWKAISTIDPTCSTCHKSLGALIRRPGWCARCGEVVCSSCLTTRRRLRSDPAHPEQPPQLDHTGVLARVCPGCTAVAGSASGPGGVRRAAPPPQGEPAERDRTSPFKAARARYIEARRTVRRQPSSSGARTVSPSSSGSPVTDVHDDRAAMPEIDLRGNCARLVSAYSTSVGTLSRRISRAFSPTSPAWVKANRPGPDDPIIPTCRKCCAKFSTFKRRDHCVICGSGHCGSCLFRSALLYLDATGKATITVLSPDAKLPPRSELVEACAGCLDAIEELVNARLKPPVVTTWNTLLPADAALRIDATRITVSMCEFRTLVDGLRPEGPCATSPGRGLVPRIAKHQRDLERLLEVFRADLRKLQRVAPESKTFELIHTNMTKSRATFLRENTSSLRELNRVLEALLPPEVLAVVADVVNKDSLIAASILVTQLAVESTLIDSKPLALSLDGVARDIREELKVLVDKDGPEEWDKCLDALSRTIKARGKEAPLLRHLAAQPGCRAKMQSRVIEVLQQLRRQLEHRATLAAIGSIVAAIDGAIEKVPVQVIGADADAEGWEVL